MSLARRVHHTYGQYLRALEMSDVKLEFCDGEIYAMAGGTPTHADLAAAAITVLRNALDDECRVSSSDLKVRIEATDLSTFPDATVTCGERRVSEIDPHAVVNPTLLVEVTSDSTEDYDRGDKLSHYKQIPSLLTVLLVSHRRPEITIVTRSEGGWSEDIRRAGEVAAIDRLELRFEVDEVYRGIELESGRMATE